MFFVLFFFFLHCNIKFCSYLNSCLVLHTNTCLYSIEKKEKKTKKKRRVSHEKKKKTLNWHLKGEIYTKLLFKIDNV
jgi:hypothetical protein